MIVRRQVTASVLVVEDDAIINMAAAETLKEQGYLVVSAANADEALRLIADRPEIDVLFTDIKMPGSIDGLALAWRTRHERPRIEIVITSGTVRPTSAQMPARATLLLKPYSVRQIADALRGSLDRTSSLAS